MSPDGFYSYPLSFSQFFLPAFQIDQKVSDQQVTLCKAAVPGFYVSNNSHEVRLQMYLLEFIQRLAKIDPPPQ